MNFLRYVKYVKFNTKIVILCNSSSLSLLPSFVHENQIDCLFVNIENIVDKTSHRDALLISSPFNPCMISELTPVDSLSPTAVSGILISQLFPQ